MSLVAEWWLLSWLLRHTAIVILRGLLLLLLHVGSRRRWLLHVLSSGLGWLLASTKRRGRVGLDSWRLLLSKAAIAIGGRLLMETLRGWVLCEVAQSLNQIVLLELTRHLVVIDTNYA